GPYPSPAVLEQAQHIVVAQGVGLVAMLVLGKAPALRMPHVYPVVRAYPQVALFIFQQGCYVIRVDGAGLALPVGPESLRSRVKQVQACAQGAYPELLPAVLEYFPSAVIAQGGRVGRVMFVMHKTAALKPVQPAKVG